jgi:hypothetical protein
MMRGVFIFLVAVAMASAATLAARADPLPPNEAEALRHALGSIADAVVDVQVISWDGSDPRVPEPFASGSSTELAFTPTTGWNGICEARTVMIDVGGPADEHPGRVTLGNENTVYKVRGALDPNADYDPGLAAVCASDHPVRDGYFDAPDPRTARDAGVIVQDVRQAMVAGRRSFQLTCDLASDCRNAGGIVAEATADRLFLVQEETPCPDDLECLELALTDDNDCDRGWSVVARFHGVGSKGYGLLQVEKVRLKSKECSRPAH